ncbi:MAG: hypothetical protein GQ531_03480 [Sulfurovum sp.]|nr:hypothetical protein [Sulfurovum sp.]
MLRTLLTFTVLASATFAANNFTVRLAAYSNTEKLSKAISAYPPALQLTVKTYKKGRYTYAYTVPTNDKTILKKLLPAYRKVFKDAYIIKTRLKKGQCQK